MFGNGPYMLEVAAHRRGDRPRAERRLDRRLQRRDLARPPRHDHVPDLRRPDTAYNAFEAGEGDNANIPPARVDEAQDELGHHARRRRSSARTTSTSTTATRASAARRTSCSARPSRRRSTARTINEAVYNGSRTTSDRHHAAGHPRASRTDLCEYCAYDPEAAQALFDEWMAAGNELDRADPDPVQRRRRPRAGRGDHHRQPGGHRHRGRGRRRARRRPTSPSSPTAPASFCRAGWFADYPTYDNFMYDLFHTDSLGGNNYGFINDEFDALVDEAKQTVDPDEQADAVPAGRGHPAQRGRSASSRSTGTSATTPTTRRRSATSRRPTSV